MELDASYSLRPKRCKSMHCVIVGRSLVVCCLPWAKAGSTNAPLNPNSKPIRYLQELPKLYGPTVQVELNVTRMVPRPMTELLSLLRKTVRPIPVPTLVSRTVMHPSPCPRSTFIPPCEACERTSPSRFVNYGCTGSQRRDTGHVVSVTMTWLPAERSGVPPVTSVRTRASLLFLARQVVRAVEEHLRQQPEEVPTVLVNMPYSMIVLDTRECVLCLRPLVYTTVKRASSSTYLGAQLSDDSVQRTP